MTLTARLNRPNWIGRLWRPLYEFGYACLRGVVSLLFAPLFRVRRVGPRPVLPPGGVVLCPNHASYLDPAFVQLCLHRRVTFVMTNDFYARSWGRWFFALVGAVPVGRGRMARRGVRRAIALAKRGHAVVLFPEGRLSRDGQMNRGQRGIARLARRADVPVIPVAIAGSMRAWRHGGKRPHRANVRVAFGLHAMRWSGPPTREAQQAFSDELMARISMLHRWLLGAAPHPFDQAPLQLPDADDAPPKTAIQNL